MALIDNPWLKLSHFLDGSSELQWKAFEQRRSAADNQQPMMKKPGHRGRVPPTRAIANPDFTQKYGNC